MLYQLHASRGARVVAYCPHLASAAASLWNQNPRERAGIRVDMPLAEATALASYQSVEKCHPDIFQPRQVRSKAPHGSPRRAGDIASMRPRSLSNSSTGCYAHRGVPHLELHDPAADRLALEALAEWCQQFSPSVGLEESEQPASLLLDVSGLGHLFGGEEALARRVVRAFAERRLTARVAIADTLAAAWAVTHFAELNVGEARQAGEARPADQTTDPIAGAGDATAAVLAALAEPLVVPPGETWAALAPLRVAALRLPEETCALLAEVGLRRIDELAAVPRGMLMSRFGPEVLARLDQATGTAAEAIVAHATPAECEFQWLFDHPTERRETIDAALEHLIARACEGLACERRGVLRLRCRFETEEHTAREWVVGLFRPSADPRHIGELARLKLEGVRFERPLAAIRVTVLATDRLQYQQQEIFVDPDASRAAPREVAALVDRLSNRLGAQAVLRPWLLAGAQPEFACQYRPVASLTARDKTKKPRGLRQASTRKSANTQARSASEGEMAGADDTSPSLALRVSVEENLSARREPRAAESAGDAPSHAHASVSMAPEQASTGKMPVPPGADDTSPSLALRVSVGENLSARREPRAAESAGDAPSHAHASVSMAPEQTSTGKMPVAPGADDMSPSLALRVGVNSSASTIFDQQLFQQVPGDRPLYLHPRPLRLPVLSIAPEGPPARFRRAGHDYHIVRVWGPERIETGWWRTRCVRRDYYQVETRDGQRFWLFRELGAGAWFLHGEFA
ncbi:MAG: DNA polymerase Y family protein [Pirellulales bacterium]